MITMQVIYPGEWKDYELIDSGNQEKLERFGNYTLARPEPQAVWKKAMSEEEWESITHARYKRRKGVDPGKQEGNDQGEWIRKKSMPDRWIIQYDHIGMKLRFRLGLTSFGHIGVFPEQADNWNFIYDCIRQAAVGSRQSAVKGLNLFAYTGGASLAAKAAGADVVHVDSVKTVVTWAREMMENSGLKDIRWVVEDAMKFVRREVKRGNFYQGIILDPPAYGRGPEGEKWILQDSINELTELCSKILEPDHGFFVLSFYSMGFSAMIGDNLVKSHFGDVPGREIGEICFRDRSGKSLPLGTFLRFINKQI